MPLDGPARPFSKTAALSRKERRYKRKLASPARWQRIIASKMGPCRVCGQPSPNNLHHLVDRNHGGSDTEANLAPLCGSGTTGCHGLVENRNNHACRALVLSLTDEEYAYVFEIGGNTYIERRYGIVYERVA